MLTAEQIAIRSTGIGASESAEVLNIHPKREALDVWMRKPNPFRGAMVTPEPDDDDIGPREIGSYLEDGIRALFERKSGKKLVRPGPVTLRHNDLPCVLASPDDLLANENAGLEIKLVGYRMIHHWDNGVPGYYLTQVAQNMAVANRDMWYVCALVGGTDFRVYSIARDAAFEDDLLDTCATFWRRNVLRNIQPETRSPEAKRRCLRALYPGIVTKEIRRVHGDPDIEALLSRLAQLKHDAARIKTEMTACENALIERLGGAYGLEGNGGRFLWLSKTGTPSWKAIAEELADGNVPQTLIEKHRGAASSEPRFTAAKGNS